MKKIIFLLSIFLVTKAYTNEIEPSYALAQGDKDRERLTILNEVYNPFSLPLLKIAPGMKVLTIGCGIGLLELEIAKEVGSTGAVLATDISVEQLKIAEQNRQNANLNNLRFLQISAEQIADIPDQFDRIHCRLVLSHLPWEKVVQIVQVLYEKLSIGGLLVMEELSSFDSLSCEPHSDRGFDGLKKIIQSQVVFQQCDPAPGKRLYQYLVDNGFSVSYSSHQPLLSTEREKSLLSMAVISPADKLLQAQLITLPEIEEIVRLLKQLEKNPNICPRSVELSQITVQRSAVMMEK